jgi:hypothetical protein
LSDTVCGTATLELIIYRSSPVNEIQFEREETFPYLLPRHVSFEEKFEDKRI